MVQVSYFVRFLAPLDIGFVAIGPHLIRICCLIRFWPNDGLESSLSFLVDESLLLDSLVVVVILETIFETIFIIFAVSG